MYDKVVYISGPYRASTIEQIEANITAAENEAIWWLSNGFAVICPHRNTYGLERIFSEDNILLPANEELVNRCDIIVMLPRWEHSEGAGREHARALEKRKVVLVKNPRLLHTYRISYIGDTVYQVNIEKGEFTVYPEGNRLDWTWLLERTKRL